MAWSTLTENPQWTPTPIAKTLGELYDAVKDWLKPEQRKELERRALKKYGMSGIMDKMREWVTGNTRAELSDLLNDMPGKDAILAKIDPMIPSAETLRKWTDALKWALPWIDAAALDALTKANDAIIKDVVHEWWKSVWQVANAIASGDIRWTVAWVKDIQSGWSKIGESISNAFATLLELLEKVLWFKLGWFSDMFKKEKKDGDKPEAAKPAAWAVGSPSTGKPPESPEEAKRRKAEEEKQSREALREKVGETLWTNFVKSGWIKDASTKKKDFLETYAKYSNEFVDVAKEIGINVSEKREWNIFDTFVKYPVLITRFIAVLIAKKIIPGNMLMTQAYDSARAGLRVYLMSPYTMITNGPSAFLTEAAILHKEDIAKLKDVEKPAIIAALHSTMAPQLYLAGKITSSLAKVSLLGMYWDQGTGFTKAKGVMQNVLGDLSKWAWEMDELVTMLGDKPLTEEFRAYRAATEKIVADAQIRATVAEAFLEAKKAKQTPTQLAASIEKSVGSTFPKDTHYSDLIRDLWSAKNEQVTLSLVSRYLRNVGWEALTAMDRIVWWARNAVNPLSTSQKNIQYFEQQAQGMLRNYGESLAKVVQSDIPWWNMIQRLKLGLTEAQFIDAIEHNHLPIKVQNAEDAKGILQQILKSIPKWMEHIFAGVTVMVICTDVAKSKWATEKVEAAFKGIASMWPIVWGLMLMHEGLTAEWWVPTKIWYLAGWGVLTLMQARYVMKIMAESGSVWSWLGRIAVSPFVTIADTISAAKRWIDYTVTAWRFAFKPGGVAGVLWAGEIEATTPLARVFARARPTGFLIIGALISYLVMSQIFERETEDMMKKAWIIKEDGTIAAGPELKDAWQKLPILERWKVLKQLIEQWFWGPERIVTVDPQNNQVVIHATGKEGDIPVSLDTFDQIRKMFDDLGIQNASLFLSVDTTKNMRNAINNLPVADEARKWLLAKFNIPEKE